jgi:hypothetical protein
MSEENQEEVETVEFPTQEEPTVETVATDVREVTTTSALIINALKCIDAAAGRGSYQGGELSTVGAVRDGLYSLVSEEVEALVKQEQAAANQ